MKIFRIFENEDGTILEYDIDIDNEIYYLSYTVDYEDIETILEKKNRYIKNFEFETIEYYILNVVCPFDKNNIKASIDKFYSLLALR
jgi:hypothetical protein